jgi:hypothetical protein
LIKPGTEITAIFAQEDWLPTLVAAAGEPSIKDELLKGYPAGEMTYKVHLDGYDQRDLLAGKGEGARKEFLYWTDDGDLSGLRYNQWKLVFMEQRAHGLDVWQDPLVPLRFPKLFNLRTDPFETADYDSIDYAHWRIDIELQGVSTPTKARKLLARAGHGSAGVNERRQLSSEGRSAMVVPTATVGRKPASFKSASVYRCARRASTRLPGMSLDKFPSHI